MIYPKQLAFIVPEFKNELKEELKFLKMNVLKDSDTVLWVENDSHEPAWAQGIWRDVQALEITSITDAQTKLKAISPTWRYHGDVFHRRGELVAEKLNVVLETEEYHFTRGVVKKPPPAFTLVEPNLIFYSRHVSRPSLNGAMVFCLP